MFCLQTPRQVEYSDWLVGSVVVLDLVGCVKLGLSCRFDDASSGELAVSSEAVNAERKFLAGHIGWILTEKLCKTDAEVMDVLVGLALNFWPICAEKLCKNDAGVVDVPVGHALNFDQFVAESCAKMVLKWPKIFGEYRPCSKINSGLWEHKFYLLLGSESTVLSAALTVIVRESDTKGQKQEFHH